jgi:hypothetical protein
MRGRSAPVLGLPTLLALLASPASCVAALGLDDHQSAAALLCGCTEAVPQFEGLCVEVLEGRLASVTPERRGDFLALFADRCGDGCEHAEACYQHVALCTAEGRTCGENRECCGYPSGNAFCEPMSQLCRPR